MNQPENEYAVDTITHWYQENENVFKSRFRSAKLVDSGHGSASVQLESEKYVIDISAWNHASCLDIEILEVQNEVSQFQHVGDCGSKDDFESYLNKFIEWVKNEY